MRLFTIIALLLIGWAGCSSELPPVPDPDPNPGGDTTQVPVDSFITYLALGDSYTIGQSVDVDKRWPNQLADSLSALGWSVPSPWYIARTGWTTDELNRGIDIEMPHDTFDLVSLLIGVNNQYRGRSVESYIPEFEGLLQRAIGFAKGDSSRVFVLSIPDYGVTPFASTLDADKIARELDAYNAVADSICQLYEIPFYDITEISREAKERPELVAVDGLHPSGEMYRRWVELIRADVEELLLN